MEIVRLACGWCVEGVRVTCTWHQEYCKDAKPQSSPCGCLGVSLRGPESDSVEGQMAARPFQSLSSCTTRTAWGLVFPTAREVSVLSHTTQ